MRGHQMPPLGSIRDPACAHGDHRGRHADAGRLYFVDLCASHRFGCSDDAPGDGHLDNVDRRDLDGA